MKNGIKSKYPAIVAALRERIAAGAYFDMLPGAAKIAAEFGVTPMTANKALNILVDEGIVRREANKGTFVCPKNEYPTALFYHEIFSVDPDIISPVLNITPRVFNAPDGHSANYVDYIAGTKNIDFISVHEGIIPALAERGLLKPLDEAWPLFKTIRMEDFHPKVLDAFCYNGTLYGIPVAYTPVMIFYNKSMFDEADVPYPDENWNWKDLENLCQHLTCERFGHSEKKTYGLSSSLTSLNTFIPFIRQNAGHLFNVDGIAEPDAAAMEALNFLRNLMEHKFCPSLSPLTGLELRKLFSVGHAGMYIGNYADYLILKRQTDFEIGIAQLPGKKERSTSLSVQGWALSAASTCEAANLECFFSERARKTMFSFWDRICAFSKKDSNPPTEFNKSLSFARRAWDSPQRDQLNDFLEKMSFFWLGMPFENKVCQGANNFLVPVDRER